MDIYKRLFNEKIKKCTIFIYYINKYKISTYKNK